MRYLKFPGDLESGINVELNQPDGHASLFEAAPGQDRKPDVVILKGRYLDHWHSEFINPHSWYHLPLGPKPTPIVVFKNEQQHPCGIVHMRNLDGHRSVCISLINKFNAWQTGVWLQIEAGDKLAISWFRDWRKTEISAINLEIINANHGDVNRDEDELIPLGDELDLDLIASEARQDVTTPEIELIPELAEGPGSLPGTSSISDAEPELMLLDPGATVIVCGTSTEGAYKRLDTKHWFSKKISSTPFPVANLVTGQQKVGGKIYFRKLSDWYEYSLAVVVNNHEYPSGNWKPVSPRSQLTLSWSTDQGGEFLEEFHIDVDISTEL